MLDVEMLPVVRTFSSNYSRKTAIASPSPQRCCKASVVRVKNVVILVAIRVHLVVDRRGW